MTFVKLHDWWFDVQVKNKRTEDTVLNYPQEFAKNNLALLKDDHRWGRLENVTTV